MGITLLLLLTNAIISFLYFKSNILESILYFKAVFLFISDNNLILSFKDIFVIFLLSTNISYLSLSNKGLGFIGMYKLLFNNIA